MSDRDQKRPATSATRSAAAAYGNLLDLIDAAMVAWNLPRERAAEEIPTIVSHCIAFARRARELQGYQWEDLAEHLVARWGIEVGEVAVEDDGEWLGPEDDNE